MKCCLVMIAIAACNGSNGSNAGTAGSAASSAPASSPTPIGAPAADAALGKCDVEFSGGATAKYTAYGSKSAVLTDHWMNDAERAAMKLDGIAGQVFMLACRSDDSHLSLSRSKSGPEIPLGPKDYLIDATNPFLNVLATTHHKGILELAGVVHVTAFDGSHIAGSIDVTGHMYKSTDPVHVTATFDYKCPGFGGCK